MYGLNSADDLHALISAAASATRDQRGTTMASGSEEEEEELKARIASHPRYPTLLQAYIDCQKVGAPPAVASLLDEITSSSSTNGAVVSKRSFGSDAPELDDFMERYCDVLVKYRSDLSRSFDEATSFLNAIDTQLSHLCTNQPSRRSSPVISLLDEAAGSSDEEVSGGETEVHEFHLKGESKDLKERLLRKYSGYLSNLKQEFSKKKKRGKLPKEARQMLLEWWTAHYNWPYPTEGDKIALAESTGLDPKQINNWFINQRKRHWKPSESMQFAVMGNLSASFYDDQGDDI